jgi:hypothetical protein
MAPLYPHMRAVAAAIALLLSAQSTFAGATLLSRDTVIHASGGAFDQQQAISHYDRFANQVGVESGFNGLTALAHQNSEVGVDGFTGFNFSGAFGEGQVRTMAPTGDRASAQSNMDLMFIVADRPMAYTIGGALGSSGTGSTLLELKMLDATQPGPIVSISTARGEGGTAGASREVSESGFLAPGEYALRVHADTNDLTRTPNESNAYFTYSFSLAEASVGGFGGGGTGGPVAVPLPSAVAGGAVLLTLVAAAQIFRRRKHA